MGDRTKTKSVETMIKYLIERTDTNEWVQDHEGDQITWTNDPNMALMFDQENDANHALWFTLQLPDLEFVECKVTEHEYINSPKL